MPEAREGLFQEKVLRDFLPTNSGKRRDNLEEPREALVGKNREGCLPKGTELWE